MDYCLVPITEKHLTGYWLALKSIIEERHYLASIEPPELGVSVAFALNNIQKNYPHYVVLIDGTVAGWCDIIPFARPTYAHSGLLGMGIVAKHRGKGIGEKLIRATLAKAQALGLIRIELTVREDNNGAINLYKKVGFVEIGIKHKDLYIDNIYYNSLCMELLF